MDEDLSLNIPITADNSGLITSMSDIQSSVSSAMGNVSNNIDSAMSGVQTNIANVSSQVQDSTSSTSQDVQASVDGVLNAVNNSASSTASSIDDSINSAMGSIGDTTNEAMGNVKNVSVDMQDSVVTAMDNVNESTANAATGIGDTSSESVKSVDDTAKKTNSSISDAMLAMRTNVGGAMDNIKDKTVSTMGNMRSSMEGVRESMGAVGLLAGTYLVSAVNSAAKAQTSTVQLQGLLKNQGISFQDTTKDIANFTSGITKMSTYSAGEAKTALINLTQRGVAYNDSLKSQGALANLAAGSNIDLSSASNLLAQAYNGRYTQLERLGIITKEQVKNGLTYQQVLDAINKRFGGAAAAQMDTYAGQIKILGNNMASMKTAIGTALLPVLTQFMETINKTIEPIIAFIKAHSQMAAAILVSVTAIGTLVGGFAVFQKVSSFLGPAIEGIVGMIGSLSLPIIGAVAVVTALVLAYKNNFGGLATTLSSAFKNISALFKTFTVDIKSGLTPIASIEDVVGKAFGPSTKQKISDFISQAIILFGKIKDTAKQVWPTIQATIISVFSVVKQLWTSVLQPVLKLMIQVMASVASWVSANWPLISTVIQTVFKGIQVIWNSVLKPVLTTIITVMGQLISWISANWPLISNTIGIVMNTIIVVIRVALAVIKGVWSAVWPVLKDIVVPIFNVIRDTISTVIHVIADIIKAVMQVINGDWSGAWHSVVDAVKTIFGGIGAIFKDIINGIGNIFKNMGSAALGWGKDLIDNIAKGIKGAIGGVKDAASAVGTAISSVLHHSVPDEGPLAHDDLWMGDMMDNFEKGITSGKYKVTNAIKGLATDMSVGIKYNAIPNINNSLQNTSAQVQQAQGNNTQTQQPQATNNSPINLNMQVDGKTWASASLKYTELTQGRNNKFTSRRVGVTNG